MPGPWSAPSLSAWPGKAYEEALRYAKEGRQFGKPIADFQAIQFMLADMAINIEAARLLVHKAAFLLDQGILSASSSSFAKTFAADTAMKVAADAVQIFGGYGFIREYPVEKYFRAPKSCKFMKEPTKSSVWSLPKIFSPHKSGRRTSAWDSLLFYVRPAWV